MGVEIVKVKAIDEGMRLNRWFLKYYPGLSLGRFNKLLRTKQIKVDGKKADAALKLSAGQEVRVPPLDAEKSVEGKKELGTKDLDFIRSLVIYKDKNIIAINKPSGLAVQGGTNTTRHVDGMLEGLKFEYEEAPKLVHRIDKETSGVLVLARDRKNAEMLTKAFKEKNLQKTYLALTRGVPKVLTGDINAPLDKVREKMQVVATGKRATTTYNVIDSVGKEFALVEASPLTGRTHQIRVHLEHIGCPIVGDDKYFGETRKKYDEFANKLFLHAYKIDLSDIYSKKLVISASMPVHFVEAIKYLGLNFKGI
ncbi:MAG: RluA family pseudouridine synthase [Alphaproteobacteria bacterium]|nr:RluA family pseudouridine synthase [Alphaproteobacteria bacterium]